jgi:hypothetical protein
VSEVSPPGDDIESILRMARPKERVVDLCLRGDLVAEHDVLERRIRDSDSLSAGERLHRRRRGRTRTVLWLRPWTCMRRGCVRGVGSRRTARGTRTSWAGWRCETTSCVRGVA